MLEKINFGVTSIYAALLAVLFVYLAFRVIRLRRALKIAIGNGENAVETSNPTIAHLSNIQANNLQASTSTQNQLKLLRAIRAHANFAEYVPFALILMVLLELKGFNHFWLHAFGMILLFGRFIHAYGISQLNEYFLFRILGMVLSFTVILGMAIILLLPF
jgi:uncharacterized protein